MPIEDSITITSDAINHANDAVAVILRRNNHLNGTREVWDADAEAWEVYASEDYEDYLILAYQPGGAGSLYVVALPDDALSQWTPVLIEWRILGGATPDEATNVVAASYLAIYDAFYKAMLPPVSHSQVQAGAEQALAASLDSIANVVWGQSPENDRFLEPTYIGGALLLKLTELRDDWANGGRLDNILDAKASQASVDDMATDLAADIAGVGDAVGGTPIAPIKIAESRTWRPSGLDASKAENIVTVKLPFAKTLAVELPLNPDADIDDSEPIAVTIVGPVVEGEPTEVEATNFKLSADGRTLHFDVPTLTVKGTYTVTPSATTKDGQELSMECRLIGR